MDRRQLRLAIGAGLVGMVASVAILWVTFHTTLRTSFWDSIAQRPLTTSEIGELERCVPPAWWTWLKVVSRDVEVPCGEAWVVQELAEKVRDRDRALWLHTRALNPALSPKTQMRIAVALLVA